MSNIPHYALIRARRNWRALAFIFAAVLIVVVAVIDINYRADAAPVSLIPGKVSGLQKTGFTSGGTLLSANGGQSDGNWIIDRVVRPGGRGGVTCQKARLVNGSTRDIPTTSANPDIPAMTIMERNGTAGAYRTPTGRIADGSVAYLGNSTTIADTEDYIPPWFIVDSNARWIGQNKFGQGYSDSSCKDPTDGTPGDYPNGNIFVFKLKNGFTIDPSVDLSTIRFQLNAIVDNSLSVRVNGQVIQSKLLGNNRPGCESRDSIYLDNQTPGFTACARTVETALAAGVFRSDRPNTLELHVQSTYSHTGLLIRDIDMIGEVLPSWSITPTATADRTTAKPGDEITWTHTARNTGPQATDKTVTFRRENGSGFGAGTGDSGTLPSNTARNGSSSSTSTYRVVQADVGKTLCRATSATPRSWNDASRVTSAQDCVTVPSVYRLTPTLTLSRSGVVQPPVSVTATPKVTNSGPTNSVLTKWQLSRIDITPAPGNVVPNQGGGQSGSGQAPCSYFSGRGVTCRALSQGNSVFNANGSVSQDPLRAIAEEIDDLPVGTKICFALSVQPVSSSSSNWDHTAPICLTVAKKPKVQVLGGDLVVGRETPYNSSKTSQVITSTTKSTTTDSFYGSWSEYAIIPSGTVVNMASGALYAGGAATDNLCSLSLLTISNNTGTSCQAGSVGKYPSGSTAPNIASRFTVNQNIGSRDADLNNLDSGRIYSVNNATSSLNLFSSQVIGSEDGRGKWVVIKDLDATVIIRDNINYTAPNARLGALRDIPQVVIIAKNIIIEPTVTNVDAWLIATGTGADGYINTCGAVSAGNKDEVNNTNCGQKLTVNGPVLANKLYMYRTFGAGVGAASGDPAEVFNLRADAYLWSSAYSSSTGRLPTVSTKELPPRF